MDVDPARPADISSSDAEHEAALARARDIRMVLGEEGWSAPVLGDSGNGAHLLYLVDLPNDDASTKLVEGVLKALARRFDDAVVTVDQAVFNAARISKVYGTVARKGDDTPDRPHRLARLLDVPNALVPVSRELLEGMAAVAPRPAPASNSDARTSRFDLETFLARHLSAREPLAYEGGRKWVLEECPFNADHKAPDCRRSSVRNDSIGFKCFHNSCAGKTWKDVRDRFEGPRPNRSAENRQAARPAAGEPNAEPVEREDVSPGPQAALPPLDQLNQDPMFRDVGIVWTVVRKRGKRIEAATASGRIVFWDNAGDLLKFSKSEAVVADATGIVLPKPAKGQLSWRRIAALFLQVAEKDRTDIGDPVRLDMEETIQSVHRAADHPCPAEEKQVFELIQELHAYRRDPRATVPPRCVFTYGGYVYVHRPTLRAWLSTPGGHNRLYPVAEMHAGLLAAAISACPRQRFPGSGEQETSAHRPVERPDITPLASTGKTRDRQR